MRVHFLIRFPVVIWMVGSLREGNVFGKSYKSTTFVQGLESTDLQGIRGVIGLI